MVEQSARSAKGFALLATSLSTDIINFINDTAFRMTKSVDEEIELSLHCRKLASCFPCPFMHAFFKTRGVSNNDFHGFSTRESKLPKFPEQIGLLHLERSNDSHLFVAFQRLTTTHLSVVRMHQTTAWTNAVENEEGYDAGCQTYDMVNGKWKMVCPVVVRFYDVYGNVMHRLQESRVRDEDYFNRALLDYEAETEVSFKLRHCSDKRYKTYGSSSFNTEYREASINLNVDVGDEDGDEVPEVR
ncbi:hypothetical protein Tco_0696611 [Tanacetum coccineum]